jgi:hypothetical protein
MSKRKQPLLVYVDEALRTLIKEEAVRAKVSASEVARVALSEYIAKRKAAAEKQLRLPFAETPWPQ